MKKRVMIQLEPEMVDELKLRSYYAGVSISAYIRGVLEEKLDRKGGNGGK